MFSELAKLPSFFQLGSLASWITDMHIPLKKGHTLEEGGHPKKTKHTLEEGNHSKENIIPLQKGGQISEVMGDFPYPGRRARAFGAGSHLYRLLKRRM